VRLVEWIELLNLLGADKIFMYQLQVHPNITKVLDHYQREGKVIIYLEIKFKSTLIVVLLFYFILF